MKDSKRQRKKVNAHFSAWEFLGNDILKEVGNETIKNSQLVATLLTAINPDAFAESIKNKKAREVARVFSEFYADKPELAIHLLKTIRTKWNDSTITAQVQRLCTSRPWFKRPEWQDGKLIQEGILMRNAKDTDLQTAIFGTHQKLKHLTSPEAVKKARQRIKPVPALSITLELLKAFRELERKGFDTGRGV